MSEKTFIMNFYCSVTDKPFTVRFKRQSDYGTFFVADIQKFIPSSDNHKSDDPCAPSEMEAGGFSLTGFQCPHCAHNTNNNVPVYFQCGECSSYVCGGKSGKILFRCRSSCGNYSFRIGEGRIKNFAGSFGRSRNERSTASSSGENAKLQLTHFKNQNLTK